MHVSHFNSRITKRLRKLPDIGKTDTKYQGGFVIVRTAKIRGRGYSSRETGAQDLSSQVCTTDESDISVLIKFVRLVGLQAQCQSVAVNSHLLELYIRLNAGGSHWHYITSPRIHVSMNQSWVRTYRRPLFFDRVQKVLVVRNPVQN